jgi:tetratricopeptide (TPR) repeat protein
MALFRKVIGKTCKNSSCTRKSSDPNLIHCQGCGTKLATDYHYHKHFILGSLTFVIALLGIVLRVFLPQQVQLQVMPLSGSVQEAGMLSQLSQLGAKLRGIYHDCQVGEHESEEVTKLLASNPTLAKIYPEFERTRLSHVLEACRRVRSGQLLAAQKLFERARGDFLKATEEDPENANAWAALGGVCMISHREEDARQAYERALAIEPESWAAHYNYGCYFAWKGETESALGHLERAVSLLGRSGNVDRTTVLDDLRQNPALGALRQDPRFARLLAGV